MLHINNNDNKMNIHHSLTSQNTPHILPSQVECLSKLVKIPVSKQIPNVLCLARIAMTMWIEAWWLWNPNTRIMSASIIGLGVSDFCYLFYVNSDRKISDGFMLLILADQDGDHSAGYTFKNILSMEIYVKCYDIFCAFSLLLNDIWYFQPLWWSEIRASISHWGLCW